MNMASAFRKGMQNRKLVLGVDRLDYTKGIPYRLRAFEWALKKYPELQSRIVLVQITLPSRTHVPEYQHMKSEIDEMIGRINGEFTSGEWVPIHYIYRSLDRPDLVSLYRACDIALVTPLRDGMNLIAKEYCAACPNNNEGVLILSEFAGAAQQMGKSALLVNPYNIESVANQIHRAYSMADQEKKERMMRLRSEVRRNDIFRWVDQFLEAAAQPAPVPHKAPARRNSKEI
jgi:trehalose 6-phosphate synthase